MACIQKIAFPRMLSSPPLRWFSVAAALALLGGCMNGDASPRGSVSASSAVKNPAAASGKAAVSHVDFNSQIRPILNQNCTSCHGGVKSAGEISFVYRDVVGQVAKKSGNRVIVPGQPDASEMIRRVTSTDKEYRMPPADHGSALPADKIALLREW